MAVRRTFKRKRSFKKKKSTKGSVTKKMRTLAKRVKELEKDQEWHFHSLGPVVMTQAALADNTPHYVGGTGTFTIDGVTILNIDPGATRYTRTSDNIVIRKVKVTATFDRSLLVSPGVQKSGECVLQLWQDTEPNGSNPASFGIEAPQQVGSSSAVVPLWYELIYPNLYSNKRRYRLLAQKKKFCSASEDGQGDQQPGTDGACCELSITKNLSIPVSYTAGGSGGIVNIRDNNLFVCVLCPGQYWSIVVSNWVAWMED